MYFCICFRGGEIIHHDVRQREHVVSSMSAHSGEVCGLKWSLDGKYLASGGNDNMLHIWPAVGGQNHSHPRPIYSMNQHQAAVKALAWCPWSNHILASGGGTADRSIRFWNCNIGTFSFSLFLNFTFTYFQKLQLKLFYYCCRSMPEYRGHKITSVFAAMVYHVQRIGVEPRLCSKPADHLEVSGDDESSRTHRPHQSRFAPRNVARWNNCAECKCWRDSPSVEMFPSRSSEEETNHGDQGSNFEAQIYDSIIWNWWNCDLGGWIVM